MNKTIFPIILGILILVTVGASQQAFGTVFQCSASLDGNQEVPPSGAAGTGTASVTYNDVSNALSWNIAYSGLTGAPFGAHFHRAAAGINGPVIVVIPVGPSPMIGNGNLLQVDEASFLTGNVYINIHTPAHPPGEIRGQVSCQPVSAVGGDIIPLDTTMVLLAGTHAVAVWMIPVIVSAIGIGIVLARKL